MKKLVLLLVVVTTLPGVMGCKKKLSDVPCCIDSKIEQFKNNPHSITTQVDEYFYQGKNVYLLTDGSIILDGGFTVLDANCNQLCFLGGIGGFTMCNGDNFFEKATFKRTLWKR